MSRQDFGAWWSAVGSAELEREMQAALGSVDDYDVVGSPSGALRAEIRAGDVLVRVEGGRTLVARVTAPGLHGAHVLPSGAEAEGGGHGLYADALERTPAGWARAPAYRIVANRQGVVQPRQIVLRPASGALRQQILFPPPLAAAVVPAPVPDAPPQAASMDEPGSPEPSPPDDDTGGDVPVVST